MLRPGHISLCLLFALLLACEEPVDETCETGDVQCPTTRTIQYCQDGVWDEAETCPPRQGAGGLEIITYCYPDQGTCAP